MRSMKRRRRKNRKRWRKRRRVEGVEEEGEKDG